MHPFGVHSEVGRLRTVLVHRPGLSLERLTPQNRARVPLRRRRLGGAGPTRARRLRGRHARPRRRGPVPRGPARRDAPTLRRRAAPHRRSRRVLLHGRSVARRRSSRVPVRSRRAAPRRGAHGGLLISELEGLDLEALNRHSLGATLAGPDTFVLPPLPNTMFTRDSSAWLYDGVVLPPLFWHARRLEVSNVSEVYRHHPRFAGAGFEFWYPPAGDAERFAVEDFGHGASLEGGDVMPIGNKTVLVGMGERSTGRMVEHIARALFASGAAERIIACRMEQGRSYMHLDTVFCLLDRDAVTVYPAIVDSDEGLQPAPGRPARRLRGHRRGRPARGGRRRARRGPTCGSSPPAETRSARRASSGTTRTTSSHSSPASSSRTRRTSRRTRRCATPGSRSSRSRARSSARGGADATA